jgi:anthranilate phosphoribosyltransferase
MWNENDLRNFGRLICRVAKGARMSREETRDAYRQVILNEQPELQQGAFLMAHIASDPTTEELAGAWDALDQYDTAKITVEADGPVCDIVGTGSDDLKTVNCSTPASLIAAACGLVVAKKGARLVTGVSGASDIFERLGFDLDAPLELAERMLESTGFCYLPGEKFLRSGWARLIKSMRFTSAFNIIGPLTKPCGRTDRIVIGAYSTHVCDQLADVLKETGMKAALAPFGMVEGIHETSGMDEFSISGPTRVVELRNGKLDVLEITPGDFGIKTEPFENIASKSDAVENAAAISKTLAEEHNSPLGRFFCANAAAALYISDMAADYAEGFNMAMDAMTSGRAAAKLAETLEFQRKYTHSSIA